MEGHERAGGSGVDKFGGKKGTPVVVQRSVWGSADAVQGWIKEAAEQEKGSAQS